MPHDTQALNGLSLFGASRREDSSGDLIDLTDEATRRVRELQRQISSTYHLRTSLVHPTALSLSHSSSYNAFCTQQTPPAPMSVFNRQASLSNDGSGLGLSEDYEPCPSPRPAQKFLSTSSNFNDRSWIERPLSKADDMKNSSGLIPPPSSIKTTFTSPELDLIDFNDTNKLYYDVMQLFDPVSRSTAEPQRPRRPPAPDPVRLRDVPQERPIPVVSINPAFRASHTEQLSAVKTMPPPRPHPPQSSYDEVYTWLADLRVVDRSPVVTAQRRQLFDSLSVAPAVRSENGEWWAEVNVAERLPDSYPAPNAADGYMVRAFVDGDARSSGPHMVVCNGRFLLLPALSLRAVQSLFGVYSWLSVVP